MMTIEEITRKLAQSHVISFQNKSLEVSHNWAGYSPSNGLYWVVGKSFSDVMAAAKEMATYGLDGWDEVDECIDDEAA